jgi:hypothetical protein
VKALILAAAALLAAWPSRAITVTGLGNLPVTSAVTSVSLTTVADAPVGSLIIVGLAWSGATTMHGCSDTAGNTYALAGGSFTSMAYFPYVCYAVVTTDLPTSSVITASWTTAKAVTIVAAVATGMATSTPYDVQGTAVSGTGTSLSVTSPPLNAANELALGLVAASATIGSHTPGTGFTNVEDPSNVVSLAMDYKPILGATPGTTTVTYSPSWTTSRYYGGNIFTFKAMSGAIRTLQTLGVGAC